MFGWLTRLLQRIGLLRPRASNALEAIEQIHRERNPVDAAAWKTARSSFHGKVFSERDRKRLWRRQRRHHPNAGPAWEPSAPTASDLACLEAILRDLQR